MRILHVHDFYAPGNGRYGFDLDRHLVRRGHEVHVLAGVGPLGPEDGSSAEGVVFHTYPYGFNLGTRDFYAHAMKSNAARFEALHRERPFDVLLFNQPLCGRGVMASPLARGVPKAYHFLAPWADEWAAAHAEVGGLRRWLHRLVRRRMERKVLKACRSIWVISRFVRERLKEEHPWVADSAVREIAGAVDLDVFTAGPSPAAARRRLGLPEGARIVATVRRLVPRMGVDLLVDAAPLVRRELPDVQFVVGGDGPLRGELEERARRSGAEVRMIGYVPDDRLADAYRAADLVVLPTRALEGFGLVLVEAMACGTPAMGTPVGAIPEVLEPLDRSLVFREATPEAIAAGIVEFFRRGGATPDLRRRVRAYVEERYDWRRVAAQAEEAIKECVAGG